MCIDSVLCIYVLYVHFFYICHQGEKFGKGALFGSTKVVRGYKEAASGEDRTPPVGHVVFVVHGIGQNMDSSSIEKNASE